MENKDTGKMENVRLNKTDASKYGELKEAIYSVAPQLNELEISLPKTNNLIIKNGGHIGCY